MVNKLHLAEIMDNEQIRPGLIAFEVTRRCRFNCRHCRADAGRVGSSEELTTEQCSKIIKSIADYNKCVVILTGGEPTERSDIYEIIGYGRELGLRMVMATCGYTIDEQSMAKLKEAGILALSFSLDSASAKTHDSFRQSSGAFDSTLAAAKTARKAGMRFQINTTVSKINVGEVAAIAELAKELGAYCFNPFIFVPTGRGEKIADEILEPAECEMLLNDLLQMKLKSEIQVRVTCSPEFSRLCREAGIRRLSKEVNGCMGGRGFGFVSYRGDVQTCGFLDVSAGNLVENNFDFGRIWEGSEFLKEIRNLSGYKGKCGVCEYVSICGGCRARAYAMTGDYLGADPVCNYQPRGKK